MKNVEMTASLFERLPRELREQIYAYVLTTSHGLSFGSDRSGVSRICERQAYYDMPNSTDQRHIWRLACIVIADYFSYSRLASDYSTFNQIQFVSRLLYRESHGLEIRYNTLFFRDCNGLTAQQRCRQVIHRVATWPSAQGFKASVSSSLSESRTTPDATEYLKLVDFCRLFPRATIQLHTPLWSQCEPGFVLFGISYLAVVRHKNESLDRVMQQIGIPLDSEMAIPISFLESEGVPDNLRLMPCEEQLDRATLLTACSQALILRGSDSALWVELAEKWFRDGI
jgi:hypothetical protein